MMSKYLVNHRGTTSDSKHFHGLLTQASKSTTRHLQHSFWLMLLLFIGATSCTVPNIVSRQSKPTVIITSPPSNSEFHDGEEIAVQSTSSDAGGVVRVELLIDNVIVHTDAVSPAQSQVALIQKWQATQGAHIILVRAYNANGGMSNPIAVSVSVAQAAPPTATAILPTPISPSLAISPTLTTTACIDNAVFVTDVTVPDGTRLAPGQSFNKIWRVRNTGCPWSDGYQLVFTSGEAMTATRAISLPATLNLQTVDLLVALSAPTTPGAHSGVWRLRNPDGQLFGTIVTVVVSVLGAPNPNVTSVPTTCSGTPIISSFTAKQRIIPVFGWTTLIWGPVTNANSIEIDQGIGQVGSPGSMDVAPTTSTLYTMTAHCGDQTATAQVRIVLPFAILGSAVSSDTGAYTGVCPKTVNFSGKITANDAGTVTYKWESSDGSNNSAVLNLTFDGPDTKTVSHSWTLGASGKTLTDYWERLHIFTPTDVTSNNATFTLRCN